MHANAEQEAAPATIWLAGEGAAWARYDLSTGALREVPAPTDDREPVFGTFPQGRYCWLDGTLVVFYAFGGQVRLRIGGVERVCTSPASVDWRRERDAMARLSLVDGSEIVASVVYFGGDPWGIPSALDPTMTDTEDFDFGEWVRRFLDDPSKVRAFVGAGGGAGNGDGAGAGATDQDGYDAHAGLAPEARAALDALPTPRLEDLRTHPFGGRGA